MSLGEVDQEVLHTLAGLRNNLERDKELTEEQTKLLQTGIGLPGNRQELWPEYYFEPGLGEVAPVIEFGVGLAGKAVRSTKMYSDKIVDKWTKFRTPNKVYHGGPPNLSTIKTAYDKPLKEGGAYGQAGAYTGIKADEVTGYVGGNLEYKAIPGTTPSSIVRPGGKGSGLYEIDITDASKVYNRDKPSKYMRGEIRKEVGKLKEGRRAETGTWPPPPSKRWTTRDLEGLLHAEEGYHITSGQREFLERYGYQAWKHKEGARGSIKNRVVLFRPEKYKIKELDKVPGTEKVRSIDDIEGIGKAKKATEKRIEKLEAKAKKKRLKNPMAYKK